MALIPQDVIDQVLAAHDIVEVVGRSVPLKSAGRAMKALCPFHEEKTPSFTVNPDRQTFKCFGCGKGGNVFRFLMEHDGLTFPEAVRTLAAERGIRIPDTYERSPDEESRFEGARKALAFAQTLFRRALAADVGAEARAYLQKRGYDQEAVERFGLGYAPPGWDRLIEAARRRKIPVGALEDAGLVVARREDGHYDRFRHRVTFPIHDLQGRVLTFGARALSPEDNPKYLNGPETIVFKKANVLYALDAARDGIRKRGEAWLMEGYTDVLMCHLHGLDCAVAGMGTAFTPEQARLLKRFTGRAILVYDGDEAGRTAAERTFDILLPEGLEVRVAFLPEGRDVDEILLEDGREVLEEIVGEARGLIDFKLRALAARHDLETAAGRARTAEEVTATILKVPSPVERDLLLREVAERLGDVGTEGALRQVASRMVTAPTRRTGGERPPGPRGGEAVRRRVQREAEAFLLAGLLAFPDLRPRILRSIGPEDFESPALRRIYNAVLAMEASGETYDHRVLTARLAEDGEAQAALAGLPEDPTLEERIPFQIEYLERSRRVRRRALQIRQALGQLPDGDVDPDAETLKDAEPPDEALRGEQPG